MDVKRTREILGDKVVKMSDKEVRELISTTSRAIDVIFELALKEAKEKKS